MSLTPFAPPAQSTPPPSIAVHVLGPPEVLLAGRLVTHRAWDTVIARDLFLLLVDCPAGASIDALMCAFWPDSTCQRARSALTSTVRRIRLALGAGVVRLQTGRYALVRPAGFECDFDRFRSLTRLAAPEPDDHRRAEHLEAALALVRGEYLDGLAYDWTIDRRHIVEHDITEATLALADVHARMYTWHEAARRYREVIARDPLREDAHRGLMHVHAAQGNRALALRLYVEIEQLLDRELGALPDPSTTALYRALRAAE